MQGWFWYSSHHSYPQVHFLWFQVNCGVKTLKGKLVRWIMSSCPVLPVGPWQTAANKPTCPAEGVILPPQWTWKTKYYKVLNQRELFWSCKVYAVGPVRTYYPFLPFGMNMSILTCATTVFQKHIICLASKIQTLRRNCLRIIWILKLTHIWFR